MRNSGPFNDASRSPLTRQRLGRRANTARTRRVLWAIPVIAAICGCSSEEVEVRVPVTPVSGSVSFNGEPAAGAQVILFPKGHALPDGNVASATVKSDGTFDVSIYSDGSGVPAGDYVVTVQWFKLVQDEGGAGRGPNVIPKQYGDPESSPVKVTVTEGDKTQIEPIEIKG